MTRIGAIEFDDRILDALRDDRLAIFAGAGVSMGPPSNLPSFWKLTCEIAQGTGLNPGEPLDRFLGQLKHRGVSVHERAAHLLSPQDSTPKLLHGDLLRLFQSKDRVRLVTTNFDLHFEAAAEALFGACPYIYRAPALPLGYDFVGIVHIHGALPRTSELVLTDSDFGRAYLTEGWARRFLVDAFRRYTILFVGYSHNDVVMNYLARALPADGVAGRFALTEDDGNWDLLGITPVRFKKGEGPDPYQELCDGVHRLADRVSRGALAWQSRLTELGERPPPADIEAISEIEQALRQLHTTRFLTNVVRDPEWLTWLDSRRHLDVLFSSDELDERDTHLASWIAEHFAISHAETMFEILSSHGLKLNPVFWMRIGREIGLSRQKSISDSHLKRWISILLSSMPPHLDEHICTWLAERCASQACVGLALNIFLAMSGHRLQIKPCVNWTGEEDKDRSRGLDAECVLLAEHWCLNEVWQNSLRPGLEKVAQPLLSGIASRLEEMHRDLMTWDKASRDWDPVCYGRSAIESHEQDAYPTAIDVIVDAARDSLEWLRTTSLASHAAWIDRLVTSDAPMLRRLAIQASITQQGLSPEQRLQWLLKNTDLHCLMEHHEIHNAVAASYKIAGEATREAVVAAIRAHTLPSSGDWSAEMRTERSHFDWLGWLVQTRPDCEIANAALAPIQEKYPDWRLSEHPELTHWSGSVAWVGAESPLTAEQLLGIDLDDHIEELLTFKGSREFGADRGGLLTAIRDACKQRHVWGLKIASVLSARSLWKSDMWPAVLRGLQESDMAIDGWHELLVTTSKSEILEAQSADIANLLYALVREGGKSFAIELLDLANSIALQLWRSIPNLDSDKKIESWLSRAINRPAGVIVEFWINGLALLLQGRIGVQRYLPDDYRQWFTMAVQDQTEKGGMSRALLASQAAFLFGLDEQWSRSHIIPLFTDPDAKKFNQAWDGFLVWGRLYPALVEALMPAFLDALRMRRADLPDRRDRFIEFCASLAVFHMARPTDELLPALFQHRPIEDRVAFTSRLGYLIGRLEPSARKQLWDGWLSRYWQDRLLGVFAVLDEREIRAMLEWLPSLGDVYPEAVALAVRAPAVRLKHGHLLHRMRDSDLVERYPTETAELIVYLCSCVVGYHTADIGVVASRLRALPEPVRSRLDDALARIGAA